MININNSSTWEPKKSGPQIRKPLAITQWIKDQPSWALLQDLVLKTGKRLWMIFEQIHMFNQLQTWNSFYLSNTTQSRIIVYIFGFW